MTPSKRRAGPPIGLAARTGRASHAWRWGAVAVALMIAGGLALATGPRAQEPGGSGAQPDTAVYGQGPDGPLTLLIWGADPAGAARPALLLFHGGGWRSGGAAQFARMCEDVSKQHITCLSANYTLGGGDGPEQEAKQAVLWAREHAAQLRIKPHGLFVGGGSVGGYLALSTALVQPQPSSAPDGLVLLNPVISSFPPGPTEALTDDVVGHLPPMIVFHGTADQLSPYPNVEAFVAKVKAKGNQADLRTFPGRGHGFFNKDPDYATVTQSVIEFINAAH